LLRTLRASLQQRTAAQNINTRLLRRAAAACGLLQRGVWPLRCHRCFSLRTLPRGLLIYALLHNWQKASASVISVSGENGGEAAAAA
jgi:hypothetical protein